jgi:hypothetical protein
MDRLFWRASIVAGREQSSRLSEIVQRNDDYHDDTEAGQRHLCVRSVMASDRVLAGPAGRSRVGVDIQALGDHLEPIRIAERTASA